MTEIDTSTVKEVLTQLPNAQFRWKNCPMCGAARSYSFEGDSVWYQCGCECSYDSGKRRQSSHREFIEALNRQSEDIRRALWAEFLEHVAREQARDLECTLQAEQRTNEAALKNRELILERSCRETELDEARQLVQVPKGLYLGRGSR